VYALIGDIRDHLLFVGFLQPTVVHCAVRTIATISRLEWDYDRECMQISTARLWCNDDDAMLEPFDSGLVTVTATGSENEDGEFYPLRVGIVRRVCS